MVNILQKPIFTDFLYPFLLMFFIVFALLEKTEIFGKEKRQINALISLVISLIFVSAIFPKIIVGNLVLFLTIALVIVFVGLLLWGFINGKAEFGTGMKTFLGIILFVAIVLAVVWSTGFGGGIESVFSFLFNNSWSGNFWTNFIIVALVIGAVAIAIGVKVKPK